MHIENLDQRSQNWIKQGRGQGFGKDYLPWLTIRDLPSSGRSHRIWGTTTQRTHHLLSDLELAVFLLLEWHDSVEDIREQFPLPLVETVIIAEQTRIAHPRFGKHITVMSSDFLIDTNDTRRPQFALQVKYTTNLFDRRVTEKLELERQYWLKKNIPWYLLTEKHIPKTVTDNLKWLYPAQSIPDDFQEIYEQTSFFLNYFRKNPNVKISQAAMSIDNAYSLEPGESLQNIRSLMAQRVFSFDISKAWTTLCVNELHVVSDVDLVRTRYAAN